MVSNGSCKRERGVGPSRGAAGGRRRGNNTSRGVLALVLGCVLAGRAVDCWAGERSQPRVQSSHPKSHAHHARRGCQTGRASGWAPGTGPGVGVPRWRYPGDRRSGACLCRWASRRPGDGAGPRSSVAPARRARQERSSGDGGCAARVRPSSADLHGGGERRSRRRGAPERLS